MIKRNKLINIGNFEHKSKPYTAMMVIVVACFSFPVFAGHENSLIGSDFEIDADANLIVDHNGIDWASINEDRKADEPSGKLDNAFGKGSKEDSENPVMVQGSIPPNKSDLKHFGAYEEVNDASSFMHLFWTRVQDPKGTTNMDFEFNQSGVLSNNGVTPERTKGDLLIVYELSKGGKVPELYRFHWLDGSDGIPCEASKKYPCWGDRTNLTAPGGASGSINNSSIHEVDADGLGALDPRTFGEASIDLQQDIFPDPDACTTYGLAYVKSRSSDSFTSALKDFIAPMPVSISNCGRITVDKSWFQGPTQVFNVAEKVTFTLFIDADENGNYNEDVDTDAVNSCETTDTCSIENIESGMYCLVETTQPLSYFTSTPASGYYCFSVNSETDEKYYFINNSYGG